MEKEKHVFEVAGLGLAPFKFVGVEEKVHVIPGVGSKAGSSCDYCGHAIRWAHWIVSADGKRFKVGSECVAKTGDEGLVSATKDAIKLAKRAIKAKKREEKMLEGQRNWCEKNGFGRITFAEKAEMQKKEREEAKAKSQYLGNVGERITATAEILAIPSWENNWGRQYCFIMKDADGNKLVWITSSGFYTEGFAVGSTVKFTATVKKHEIRDNEKQTVVYRTRQLEV